VPIDGEFDEDDRMHGVEVRMSGAAAREDSRGIHLRPVHVWLVGISVYAPIMFLLLFRSGRWILAHSVAWVRFVSLGAVLAVLFAVCLRVIERRLREQGDEARARSLLKWLPAAGLAGLALGGEMAGDIAAADLHQHIQSRYPHVKEFYANQDIARLVGCTIQMVLLRTAEESKTLKPEDHASLKATAQVAPARWRSLVAAGDPRAMPLTEHALWSYVEDPTRVAMDGERWKDLLGEWAGSAGVARLTPAGAEAAAAALCTSFSHSWREALKHDYVHGGKAWAALQLDLAGELLRRTTRAASDSDPDSEQALAEMAASLSTLDRLMIEVRKEHSEYHSSVLSRLESSMEDLRKMAPEVARIADGVGDIQRELIALRGLILENVTQRSTENHAQPQPASIQDPDLSEAVSKLTRKLEELEPQIESMSKANAERELELDLTVRISRASDALGRGDFASVERLIEPVDVEAVDEELSGLQEMAFEMVQIRCLALLNQGKFQEALPLAEKLVEIRRGSASAHQGLGFLYEQSDRAEDALREYEESARLDPSKPAPTCNAGKLLAKLGRFELALEMYERTIAADAGHIDAYFDRAVMLSVLGRHADANAALEGIRSMFAKDPKFLAEVGQSLTNLGRLAEAESQYELSLELDPAFARSHSMLAILLAKRQATEKALQHSSKAVELEPRDPYWHYNRGIVLGLVASKSEAALEYRRAVDLRESYWEAWRNLSVALFQSNDVAGAVEAGQKALLHAPDSERAHLAHNLSQFLERAGELGEPIESPR
jgi:tetratricopeptide (TPR) repeat protein